MKNKPQGYDDIIHLPHHQSKTRPHMSLYDRAAQFSPFAALTGYDDVVKETARLTSQKVELSEEVKMQLNRKLAVLQENIKTQPKITVTYFVPDEKKSGGTYVTETGVVRRIDTFTRMLLLAEHTLADQKMTPISDIAEKRIPINDIAEISGGLFQERFPGENGEV